MCIGDTKNDLLNERTKMKMTESYVKSVASNRIFLIPTIYLFKDD